MYVEHAASSAYAFLTGLQAYDSHCNLVLGDVEETVYVVEEDEDDEEVLRVGMQPLCAGDRFADILLADNTQEIRDAVRSRCVSLLYFPWELAQTLDRNADS